MDKTLVVERRLGGWTRAWLVLSAVWVFLSALVLILFIFGETPGASGLGWKGIVVVIFGLAPPILVYIVVRFFAWVIGWVMKGFR